MRTPLDGPVSVAPRGFTLIEVVISSVLFLTALGGIFAAFHSATALESHFRKATLALEVGSSVLEQLILEPTSAPDLAAATSHQLKLNDDGVVAADGDYTVTWSVVDNKPSMGLKTIDLTIQWSENRRAKSLHFTTIR